MPERTSWKPITRRMSGEAYLSRRTPNTSTILATIGRADRFLFQPFACIWNFDLSMIKLCSVHRIDRLRIVENKFAPTKWRARQNGAPNDASLTVVGIRNGKNCGANCSFG